MSIPKVIYPLFTIEQPSNQKKLSFRRYLVKEEKILLMAKESGDINDIFTAIKQVVEVCCQEPTFNVNDIPLFDLEYLYLQLRSASVTNVEKFTVTDKEDGKIYDFMINFDTVKVIFPDDAVDNRIQIDKNLTMVMKYPPATLYDDDQVVNNIAKNGVFELVIKCVDKVFNGDELVEMDKQELVEFVESLDVKTYKKFETFLVQTPALKYEVKYTNSLDHERSLEFKSLIDFFLYL